MSGGSATSAASTGSVISLCAGMAGDRSSQGGYASSSCLTDEGLTAAGGAGGSRGGAGGSVREVVGGGHGRSFSSGNEAGRAGGSDGGAGAAVAAAVAVSSAVGVGADAQGLGPNGQSGVLEMRSEPLPGAGAVEGFI